MVKHFDGCKFNNWTKSNPVLSADIIGDWREEVLTRDEQSTELRLYVRPTCHRLPHQLSGRRHPLPPQCGCRKRGIQPTARDWFLPWSRQSQAFFSEIDGRTARKILLSATSPAAYSPLPLGEVGYPFRCPKVHNSGAHISNTDTDKHCKEYLQREIPVKKANFFIPSIFLSVAIAGAFDGALEIS